MSHFIRINYRSATPTSANLAPVCIDVAVKGTVASVIDAAPAGGQARERADPLLFISSISVGRKDLAACHGVAGKIGAGGVSPAGALNNERRLPSTSRRDVQLASRTK